MNLLSEIEKAHARKRELLDEIAAIDDELERAKLAISGRAPVVESLRRRRNGEVRDDGSVPNEIFAALAAKEPRTLKDISSYTRKPPLTLQAHLKAMANAGQIARRRLDEGTGRPMIYARTEGALYPQDPPREQAADAAADEVAAEAG